MTYKRHEVEEDLQISRNPILYYAFKKVADSVDKNQDKKLTDFRNKLKDAIAVIGEKQEILEKAASDFMQESKMTTRSKLGKFSDLEHSEEAIDEFRNESLNFIVIMSQVFNIIENSFSELNTLSRNLHPPHVLSNPLEDKASYQEKIAEIQLNGHVLEEYIRSLGVLLNNSDMPAKVGEHLYKMMEMYYKMLMHRHTTEGVKIFTHPVITDIALRVFENVDSHGEIESGKHTDQISAYTIRKAEILTSTLKDPTVNLFLDKPETIVNFISDSLREMDNMYNELTAIFEPQLESIQKYGVSRRSRKVSLNPVLNAFKDVNPADISYREPTKIVSDSEKLVKDIKNETIQHVVELLLDPKVDFKNVINYILERKGELKKFFHDENSFYVCKIGEGNPFMGTAPGALYVTPAERPRGDMKWILGSGFSEIKEFAESIESAAKWHNLFVATSPSKTADKSNVLMIGPAGCGKTEVLRAVGGDKKSIGIFAQGSDFNTCWKGEAEKNPKRLFDEGVKLNKESGKHVHFLIDEIDALLNNDRDMSGGGNLTLEFQILMDGVVRYPNLSVWGATNHPERIPMPMMRRFSKVLIVGELNQEERKKLLRHFLEHMPVLDTPNEKWEEWGTKLEGATGDVIRKIADYLWREKMNTFVKKSPDKAEEVAKILSPDGQPFSIDKLDRQKFKDALKHHVFISPADVDRAINECITNVSIRHEIDNAVKTYAAAKKLLNKLKETELATQD